MIQPIVTSPLFLAVPSETAGPEDLAVAQDLLDTLAAHEHECVGLAANMIGVRKRVVVFDNEGTPRVMFNPVVLGHEGEYQTEESCLSLKGARATTRWSASPCATRTNGSSGAPSASPAGPPRSSSTKSTTATGLLSDFIPINFNCTPNVYPTGIY